jgi:hypothetical protein
MQIINIIKSKRKNKRYSAILSDNRIIHFGDKNGSTYLDHNDKKMRDNYIKRHYANQKEKYLIDNLIISPSLLSMYILWGKYTDIYKNMIYLNNLLINNKGYKLIKIDNNNYDFKSI